MLPSDQTFFGLTFDYDQRVMDQVFDLIYYSKGGFTFTELYEMPVNLRSYYYVKLAQTLENEAAAQKSSTEKN
jgi:hypothetical protein